MTDTNDALSALRRLHTAARDLAHAASVEDALDALMHHALDADGAEGAIIVAVGADNRLQVLATTYGDESRNALDGAPVTTRRPLTDAIRSAEPIWLHSQHDIEARYPDLVGQRFARAWVALPLRVGTRVIGALGVGYDRPQEYDDTQQLTLCTIADICAVVLDRELIASTAPASLQSRLHEFAATALARDRADGLQRFAAAMARAASIDAVIEAISTEGSAAVGGRLVKVMLRHVRDTTQEILETVQLRRAPIEWAPLEPENDNASVEALRTGEPAYYGDLAPYRAQFGTDDILVRHGVRAAAAMPLVTSDGRIMGSLGFAFATPQEFDEEQCAFLEAVADVAAQSIDRARLYERERDVASTLQLALLPSALPELDDVETEARYVAGTTGVAVGGDWYDVLRLSDGRVGLLIGDAAGHGIEAAVVMGKVRHAAAAIAMDHQSPAAVLGRVNEYLYTIAARRAMLTCCYVVLDRDRGQLSYASAGHPPPLLAPRDDEPFFLAGGRGVPLGVVPGASYRDAHHQLSAASTLVLYTDGLIERRGETIDDGLDRLLQHVRGQGEDVKDLCDSLTRTLLPNGGDDDVALLVARVHTVASASHLDLEVPADTRRLHELRVRVDRWLNDAGIARDIGADVVIALNEAASNSILHAYRTDRRGRVRIAIDIHPDAIVADVVDTGRWMPAGDDHDGHGVELMSSLMTRVDIERSGTGTRVHLVRDLERPVA